MPPNSQRPEAFPAPIDRDECLRLLAAREFGHVGASVRALPVVFPVRYVVAGKAILFSAGPGSDLAAATLDTIVAFEIDDTDPLSHEGWSVLVIGRAHQVADGQVPNDPREPHADGRSGNQHNLLVSLPLEVVSGHRIELIRS